MSETAFLERSSLTPWNEGGDLTRGGAARGKSLPKESLLSAKGFGRPPIRIPVIPENRGVLRELRARELALWDGQELVRDEEVGNRVDAGREDRESQLILLLLGGAALAANMKLGAKCRM